MNVLDGVDILVISYCASAIASSWNVGPEALGIVFSSGLAGIMVGSLFLAPFADQLGRKKMIIICALLMGFSMFLTGYTQTVPQLLILRFISGLGIGAMLASTAVLTAEFSPNRSRNFWISLVVSGNTIGAVISGLIAAKVVPEYGWELMFKLAGIASFITLPLILIFLSESISYYLKKQPEGALISANKIMHKLGFDDLTELPDKEYASKGIPVAELVSEKYKANTLKLWLALFMAFASMYFLISWIPKLSENTGLSASLAIYAGAIFNFGAFFGMLIQGYISTRIGLRKTIAIFLIAAAVIMAIFKVFLGYNILLLIFGVLGFTLQGGFAGLYAFAARMYPTEFRTTGLGWAIGIGRLGAVFGPLIAGVLIGIGLSMTDNFKVFAIPTLFSGIIAYYIRIKND